MVNTQISIVLLTSDEVCNILNVSSRTLQTYRDKQIINFVQCGRKILYTESDIQTFLDAHHIKAPILKGGRLC